MPTVTTSKRPVIKFGTDGWRGIIADDFTVQNVRYVAQGIANYLRRRPEPKVVVGFDCRFAADRICPKRPLCRQAVTLASHHQVQLARNACRRVN